MIHSKYDAIIQIFIETPVVTAAEARAAGIPSRMLDHFCKIRCEYQWLMVARY